MSDSSLTLPTTSEREARLQRALRECERNLGIIHSALEGAPIDHEVRVLVHATRMLAKAALQP